MEEHDTIDLREIKNIVAVYKYRLLLIVAVTTLFALVIAFTLPKQYESTVLVRAKSQKPGSGISLQAASALAILGGGAAPNATQTYIEMMKSRSVLDPVIAQLDLPDKEKIEAKGFAQSTLKIVNTKGTDLLEITATGRTPEEAQQIAALVLESFQQNLTRLNQSEQSLMVKFLKDRITVAKQEMEQAERNLEQFRQREKVYIPDEQAKASIKKLTEYDQKIAQFQIQNEANQAKLQGVNGQLAKQNAALTTYNLTDNLSIEQIRSVIVTKQIELVDMEQRYTAKHPGVILVKKEIEELTAQLKAEVANSVQASTSTLNPVHVGLLVEKVKTETELLVGQASLEGLKRVQIENEQEISKLSANGIAYIGLERQVKIAIEVYGVLVKNYEQNKIQEAMESMDIQIVDAANLPQRPSAPRKLLITAIGGVLGIMFSFIYVIILYTRNSSLRGKPRIVG